MPLTPDEKAKLKTLRFFRETQERREERAAQEVQRKDADRVAASERQRQRREDPVQRAIDNEKSKLAMRRRRRDPEYRALERARATARKEGAK